MNPNNFELNKGEQFIFALDVSRSMGATDCPGGLSRIEFSKESAKMFATEAAKYDPDGADTLRNARYMIGATSLPHPSITSLPNIAIFEPTTTSTLPLGLSYV